MKIARACIIATLLLTLPPLSRGQDNVDNVESGLDPVYEELQPQRTKLVPEEKLASILQELPGWKYSKGRLYKVYETVNFTDAIALIVKLSYVIQKYDHHPELRNIYAKVYVGFTTYDQGKKVTETDVQVARDVEVAAKEFGGKPIAH